MKFWSALGRGLAFPFTTPEPYEGHKPVPGCRHLKARIYGNSFVGFGACPTCGDIRIYEILNGFLDEMREKLDQ